MRMEVYKPIDIMEAVHILEMAQDGLDVEDPHVLYDMIDQVINILIGDEE